MRETISENLFEIIVKYIGVISVEFYFLSPIIAIVKYKLGKCELHHVPFIQILVNLVNCSSYIVSGINLGDSQQFICNIIGVSISAIYIVLLWTFYSQDQKPNEKNKENKTDTAIYIFMLFNIIFQIFYFLRNITFVIQILSCFLNILMYAAGFIYVYEAYKSRKAEFVPWQGACCGLISTVMWICYTFSLISRNGLVLFNKYFPSLIANSVGFLLLVGIIICYFMFVKKFSNNRQKNNSLLTVNAKSDRTTKTEFGQDCDDDDD